MAGSSIKYTILVAQLLAAEQAVDPSALKSCQQAVAKWASGENVTNACKGVPEDRVKLYQDQRDILRHMLNTDQMSPEEAKKYLKEQLERNENRQRRLRMPDALVG